MHSGILKVATAVGAVGICTGALAVSPQIDDPNPLKDLPSFSDQLIRTGFVLAGLIVLLLLVLRYVPRLRHPTIRNKKGILDVIHSQSLDAGNRVYLVRVADSYLLIGASRDGLRTLAGGQLNAEAIDSLLSGEPSKRESTFHELLNKPEQSQAADSSVAGVTGAKA